jgi:hypothetical protein
MSVFKFGWILLALLLVPADTFACSCSWGGPFLTVAPKTALIVRAKVLGYSSYAMDVEIQETLKGDATLKKVRIWGDWGGDCRPYVSMFPVGTEWIFAISPDSSKKGDYGISVCGEFWAEVNKETVKGFLTSPLAPNLPGSANKKETMSLKQFREKLESAMK